MFYRKAIVNALTTILAIITLQISVTAYTLQPIPSGSKAYTNKNYIKLASSWKQRTTIGSYKKIGKHNSKWDASATKFLLDYYKWGLRTSGAPSSSQIKEEALALGKLDCDDPLIQSCCGIALYRCNEAKEAEPLLVKAYQGFKGSSYYKCRAFLVPVYLISIHKDQGNLSDKDRMQWINSAATYAYESMKDGSFKPDEIRMMVDTLFLSSLCNFGDIRNEYYTAVKSHKDANQYFVKYVGGLIEIDNAWADRGSDWAYTVKEDQWNKFFAHLKTARTLLTAAWKLHPECPEAPTAMITVAMGSETVGSESPRAWFDRAVKAQLDYQFAYQKMIYSLLPRWGGSIEALENFGSTCLKTHRFDTAVPLNYYLVEETILSEMKGDKSHLANSKVQAKLKAMFEGYEKTQFAESATNYKSIHAGLAYYSGNKTEAKKLLMQLGSKVNKKIFCSVSHTSYDSAKKKLKI